MAEKLPCTAVEKRKPLGTFWLECCGLARGAPRRPGRGAHWLGAAERFFTRFRLGKPKNLWIALPKNLEKASKRAFRDSKKNAPS